METQKKTWETPQLIVLARGTPEETLTSQCKTTSSTFYTLVENPVQDNCNQLDQNCGACQARNSGAS